MQDHIVIAGGLYRHFKGGYFVVDKIAEYESGGSCVVYSSAETQRVFVRPLEEFFTDVSEREDNKTCQKYRFEPVKEIESVLSLIPTDTLLEEISKRPDNPYDGIKKIEEDDDVWDVSFIVGRVVPEINSETGEEVEVMRPVTPISFGSFDEAVTYRNKYYANKPCVIARRVTKKIAEY